MNSCSEIWRVLRHAITRRKDDDAVLIDVEPTRPGRVRLRIDNLVREIVTLQIVLAEELIRRCRRLVAGREEAVCLNRLLQVLQDLLGLRGESEAAIGGEVDAGAYCGAHDVDERKDHGKRDDHDDGVDTVASLPSRDDACNLYTAEQRPGEEQKDAGANQNKRPDSQFRDDGIEERAGNNGDGSDDKQRYADVLGNSLTTEAQAFTHRRLTASGGSPRPAPSRRGRR